MYDYSVDWFLDLYLEVCQKRLHIKTQSNLELVFVASSYVFMDQTESLDGARTACQDRFGSELLKTPTEEVINDQQNF